MDKWKIITFLQVSSTSMFNGEREKKKIFHFIFFNLKNFCKLCSGSESLGNETAILYIFCKNISTFFSFFRLIKYALPQLLVSTFQLSLATKATNSLYTGKVLPRYNGRTSAYGCGGWGEYPPHTHTQLITENLFKYESTPHNTLKKKSTISFSVSNYIYI